MGLLVLPSPALAQADEPAESDEEGRIDWSATFIVQGKAIAARESTDAVGGFFDQYEYTPNKSAGFPIELGIRDGHLDVFDAGDVPIFQLRLLSPTSNLGVSGSDVDQPFFNQRIETTTRSPVVGPGEGGRWMLDLDYQRMRTEQLRRFPDTEDGSLVFDDQTARDDRFFRDRTGLDAALLRRSGAAWRDGSVVERGIGSELELRGGYEGRNGLEQRRAHRDPVNDWLGLPAGLDRDVSDVGVGLLVGGSRDGRWLATMDFDHERLRFDSPQPTEAGLGASPPSALRPVGFVPDSNRNTMRVAATGRPLPRLSWNASYQLSVLEQVGTGTPEQEAAGLDDNDVWTHAVSAGLHWRVADRITVRADLDFDHRDNRIDRTTSLFNPTGGVQVDPFVDEFNRTMVRAEGEWRFLRRNTVSLGVRYDGVQRSLDFAEPGGARILPENALIAEETRMIDVYAKSRLRMWRGLRVRADLGYRFAPKTGYVTDLDDYLHGRLDLRYALETARPVTLTAFARGDTGSNDQFEMVAGLGPDPSGPALGRRFDRWSVQWGLGFEASPMDRLSLFASFVRSRIGQQSGVVTSSWQRYLQELGTPSNALSFTDLGLDDLKQQQASVIAGLHRTFEGGFDAGASYTFTRADALYEGDASPALDLLEERRRIDNQTHVMDLEVGWRPTEGMRLLAGYRLQRNRDDVDPPESVASAATPIDRSTHQHTVTLGVTLTGAFFDRNRE